MATYTQDNGGGLSGIDWSQAAGGWGVKIDSGHTLVGKYPTEFKVYCYSSHTSGGLTGHQNMTARLYDSTLSTVRCESNAVSTSTLNNSATPTLVTFTFTTNAEIQAGDLLVTYIPTSIGDGGWICEIDSSNSATNENFFTHYSGGSQSQTNRELRFSCEYDTSGSGGGGSGGGGGGSEGDAPTGDGIPDSERLQILQTVIPR